MVVLFQKCFFVVFTVSQSPYVILCHNFMMVQTGQVPHRRIRRLIAVEDKMLLLLKSPTGASTIAITEKQNKSDIPFVVFWDEIIDLTDTSGKHFIRW